MMNQFWLYFPTYEATLEINIPLVTAETVHHSSSYIILYILHTSLQWLREHLFSIASYQALYVSVMV